MKKEELLNIVVIIVLDVYSVNEDMRGTAFTAKVRFFFLFSGYINIFIRKCSLMIFKTQNYFG